MTQANPECPTDKQIRFARCIARMLRREKTLAGTPFTKSSYSAFISEYKDEFDRAVEQAEIEADAAIEWDDIQDPEY